MKRQRTKLLKSKRFLLIVIAVIAVIVVLIARLCLVLYVNHNFQKGMTYDKDLGYAKYYLEKDGYIFKYRSANFINTDAFGSVCSEESQNIFADGNGNLFTEGLQITLFIWPFSNKMGLEFYELDDGKEISEQIYIDENLNCITEDLTEEQTSYITALINDNKNEINELIKQADEKWDID